jgi:hypothetical protein
MQSSNATLRWVVVRWGLVARPRDDDGTVLRRVERKVKKVGDDSNSEMFFVFLDTTSTRIA